MCLLRGIILGALLIVGGAYLLDKARETDASAGIQRTLVNWAVIGEDLKQLAELVHSEWNRLTG